MRAMDRGRPGDHFGDAEFVDLLEGTLPAPRTAHVDGCEACRRQADDLLAAWQRAAGIDVPEPPPFFWTQLSARVRDVVAVEPGHGGTFWRIGSRRVSWWALATAAALILAAGLWRGAPDGRPAADPGVAAVAEGMVPDGTLVDVDLDEDWALVRSVADGLTAEAIAAAGVGARPGAAEGMLLRLTDAERRELARLLEAEINQAATPESSS